MKTNLQAADTKVLDSTLGGGQLTECHYIYQNNILMKRIKLWWRHDMHWHLLTITTVIVYWGAQWLQFNVTTDQQSHLNKRALSAEEQKNILMSIQE